MRRMRALAYLCNVLLRGSMVAILAEALLRRDDPRFAGKAIGPRGWS